jgi:hypothetical protein
MRIKSTEILGIIEMPLPRFFNTIISAGKPEDYNGKPQTNWTTRKALYAALKQLMPNETFFIKKLEGQRFEILHKYERVCIVKQIARDEIEVIYG